MDAKIIVLIPAYNEAESIHLVIQEIPSIVHTIIVVNNNSTDATAQVATQAGVVVLHQPIKGYGNACLLGLQYIAQVHADADIIVFLDGDYSDYPQELTNIVQPIIDNKADFVIGARVAKWREQSAMTPQQIFGNWLATTLMRIMYRATYTDLGPFRAITYSKLLLLHMQDTTYGWTVEMQLKALKHKLNYTEIPVHYKKRIGISKVSGTVTGTIGAGYKIISWILKYTFQK